MSYRRSAWVEIDPSAITKNVRTLKAMTRPGTAFMAVVKADGYGHGALLAAHAALAGGADRLGVATLEEAVELREGGISVPVHILSEPPVSGVGLVIEHKITTTLFSREFAVALSRAAMLADVTVPYHFKVDSGMNRIGVRAEDAHDMAVWLKALPGLEMEGVFTHFATADVPGDWEFDGQVKRFHRAVEKMRTEGV